VTARRSKIAFLRRVDRFMTVPLLS
jgi:hypothetical protein